MPAATSATNVLDRLVQRAERLYSLPAVALEVLELTSSPRVDVRALKSCVEHDPALTSRILRVVNSSLFGLNRKVGDLGQAVALIGGKPLRLLVLGFSLPKELLSNVEAEVLHFYWGHAIVKAVAAREIMERLYRQPGDEAFLAGLLQDLGILVLAQDLGETYCQFLEQVIQGGEDLGAIELETLGFDHRVLSARLLASWSLPELIVQAVGCNDEPTEIAKRPQPVRTLCQALLLAEWLTAITRENRIGLLPQLNRLGAEFCGLSAEHLQQLVTVLDEKVPQLSEILSVPVQNPAGFVRLLADAQEKLAGLSMEMSLEQRAAHASSDQRVELDLNPSPSRAQDVASNGGACGRRPMPPPNARSHELWLTPSSASRANIGAANEGAKRRAAGIPNTELDIDLLGLTARVEAAVGECRRRRCPLSLLLIEADPHQKLLVRNGPEPTQRFIDLLGELLQAMGDGHAKAYRVGEARFAYILENCDRGAGVEFARNCVHAVRSWSKRIAAQAGMPITISAGLATLTLPPKNFPAPDLIQAAERCLSGVLLSGGDSQKSIDIY